MRKLLFALLLVGCTPADGTPASPSTRMPGEGVQWHVEGTNEWTQKGNAYVSHTLTLRTDGGLLYRVHTACGQYSSEAICFVASQR